MASFKVMATLMSSSTYANQDESSTPIDMTKYIGMISSLLYQTVSCHDITFSVCLCGHYQSCPKEYYLSSLKRIMKYLKGTTNLGQRYPKGSVCNLVGYSDSDYASCKIDRKSTNGTYS